MKKLKKSISLFISLLLVAWMGACSYNGNEDSSTALPSLSSSSEEISGEESSSEEISSEESSSEEISSEESSSEEISSEESSSEEISSEESSSEEISSEESSSSSSSSGEDGPYDEPPTPQKPSYELVKPLNDKNSSKVLVKTKYKTQSAVVADVIATDFGADPTGGIDSTIAIQTALDRVKALGGGTVFLPIGTYLVSSTIHIPDYVSLVGDWNQPKTDNMDEAFDYGTVILAKPDTLASLEPQDKALFTVGNCAGMVGMTFYYVEQDARYIQNYGYTVYANAPATATLRNLTFLNSTYGIGVSLKTMSNELVNLENIYGTFLFNAIHHNATTDVGFYDNINISPKYWENASKEYKCTNAAALKSFINDNLTAMILGDLDDQLISNIHIDGGKIGIKFTTGIRSEAGFWGLVYNAEINCQKGVYADYLNAASGVVFTDSNVGIVENNSPIGCVKMSNSTYQGTGSGRIIQESGNVSKGTLIDTLSLEFSSSERLFIANTLVTGGMTDNAASLQKILNSVGEEGGIVVVPNGIYRLDSSIVIPKNVELRSTQSIFSRSSQVQTAKNGVIFISYISGASFVLKDNAGIVGVRIWHPKNDYLTVSEALSGGTHPNDISIKAEGMGGYAYMNESVGAYVGYDFSSCDNHILKSNYGLSYINFIKAGGENGVITQCLSNPNFMSRTNLYNYFDSSLAQVENWKKIRNSGEVNEDFAVLRDDIGRTFTKMVRLENAKNQLAFNVFCYGQAGLFDIVDSTVTLVNTSLDYLFVHNYVYELSGGSCDIIGSLRVYGISLKVNSGTLTAYGRIAFGQVKEKAYDSSVALEDEIEYASENAKRKTLFNCDSWFSPFNASYNSKKEYVIEGSGSWRWKTTTFEGTFTSIDISEYKQGYLHFYIYCSDISQIGTVGQIEITSSGHCDENEYNWNLMQHVTKTGWNEVWLDLFGAGTTGGVADLSSINYMRIYTLDASATFYIDNIEVVAD